MDYSSLPPFNYFGSQDSNDWDVVFSVNANQLVKPDLMKAETLKLNKQLWLLRTGLDEFCYVPGKVNSNLALFEDGVITKCYKGTEDEMNNALLDTYHWHDQPHPCMVTKRVPRDIDLKVLRTFRVILSFLSRTEHRVIVKQALYGNLWHKMEVLKVIKLHLIQDLGTRNIETKDFRKVMAFQLGQTLQLLDFGGELYTKRDIATYYRELAPLLAREDMDNSRAMPLIGLYLSYLIISVDNRYTEEEQKQMYEPGQKRQ